MASADQQQAHAPPDNWASQDDQANGVPPPGSMESANGGHIPVDEDRAGGQSAENQDYPGGPGSDTKGESYREKQVKPNKVYIGGLPEHTTPEDLQNCFGKIGSITAIELKVGYGFVEFDTREAAEESVSKYHEGYFMGNKIRVELSRGGGRTAKFNGDPGACFKCGQMGHWARECPNHNGTSTRRPYDSHMNERVRDYPPAARGPPQGREDYGRPPPREARYEYQSRDVRRPPSPREYRDYGTPPPPPPGRRDYDDYRRGPPPVPDRDRYPPPPSEYRGGGGGRYPPSADYRGGNSSGGGGSYGAPPPPPPAGYYDRYDRRPAERYPPTYPPASGGRPRTPPRDFDRAPPRLAAGAPHIQHNLSSHREYDYRGRPPSPPPARYDDYPPRPGMDPAARRRSESPPRMYDPPYAAAPGYNNYPPGSHAGPAPPQRGPPRDYVPRNGRDPVEPGPAYRRH